MNEKSQIMQINLVKTHLDTHTCTLHTKSTVNIHTFSIAFNNGVIKAVPTATAHLYFLHGFYMFYMIYMCTTWLPL